MIVSITARKLIKLFLKHEHFRNVLNKNETWETSKRISHNLKIRNILEEYKFNINPHYKYQYTEMYLIPTYGKLGMTSPIPTGLHH